MNILVTGGCGYKGHVLIPKLLQLGHRVVCFDTQWFGNYLQPHPFLKVIKGDVRAIESVPLVGIDAIIHLASIANDPCGDLNPKLTWEVSALATMQLADKASRLGVKRFIYASSGSVYGVKEEEKVTEDLTLDPLSEYNKTKMVAERVVLSYQDKMNIQIVRPGTVCGFSPRMRFDVAVNMMVIQALTKGQMTVLGGNQIRPNIHMEDITDVYIHLLNHPEFTGIYNAAFENLSILDIADEVKKYTQAEIVLKPSNDPRSYRIDSTKLLETGFVPKKSVNDAIQEIIQKFYDKECADEPRFYNLRWMQQNAYQESVLV